jgi:hypothetical protein
MKEYFIFINQQEGPYTIDQLRNRDLKYETPVWHDGLSEWTTVGLVPELRGLVKATPPPYIKASPPTFQAAPANDYDYQLQMQEYFAEEKKYSWGTVLLVGFMLGCLGLLIWAMSK